LLTVDDTPERGGMSRAKKIVLFLGMALGFILVAVSALVLFLPRLIDLESVKTKTTAAISEKTGAVVRLDQVSLSYFPRLRVTISGVNIQLSDDATIHAESLSVYPSLMRLLSGKVQIADVQVQSPVISIRADKKKPPAEENIDTKIAVLLGSIASGSPGLEVSVRDGVLNLAAEGNATLTVKSIDVDVDFGRTSTEVTASGSTGFMKHIAFDIAVRTKDKSITRVAFTVNAEEIDVIRTGEVVLPLAGEVPVVRTIFSYLRGGNIPALSVKSEAGSITELGKADNIIVRGDLRSGKMSVPGTVLEFSEVSGTCRVSKGLLEAESVTGMLGSTGLRNARVKVGVQRGDVPFRLETEISSTIGEASGITGKLLKEPPAILSRLGSIKGTFEGRLVLGESTAIFRAGSDFRNGMIKLTAKMKPDFAQKITIDLDFRQGGGPDGTRLDAEAHNLDLQQTESSLRALLHEMPALGKVFSYVPSGLVPVITFSAKGATFGDLGEPEHFAIRGQLGGGTVIIPETGLAFNKVNGTYSVERGVLGAADMKAELNNGSLKNGTLKVALGKGDGPFHLDADAALTAAAAQQLLRRFVKEPTFPLDRLRDLQGMVTGKLALGENTAAFANWKEHGTFGFDGRIDLAGGPAVDLALKVMPGGVGIRRLRFQDAQSNATISLNYAAKHIDGQFDGTLTTETLARVIRMPELQKGQARGSINAAIDLETITKSTVRGRLSIAGMPLLLREGLQLNIKTMDLRAEPGIFFIDAAAANIGDTDIALRGTIKPGPKNLVLDTDLSAGRIEWGKVKQLWPEQKGDARKEQKVAEPLAISGVIRVSAENFVWDRFTISPLRAKIDLAQERTAISVNEAAFCGISAPGKIILEKGVVEFFFSPSAKDRELLPTAACLSDQKSQIRGTFSLEGNLKARGTADQLVRNLNGDLSFSTRNGSIDKSPRLARVLAFIDLSELFSGSIPDIGKEQFPYRSVIFKGDLKNGKLLIRDAIMDAPAFEMVATGEIDYVSESVDIKLLAAPFSTIDSVIKRIPIVKNITGGSLVAVPVHVTGNFTDLKTQYIPLSAVGSGLLGMMERTIKLPVSIFQPSAPAENK
jgi:hypothetical protein